MIETYQVRAQVLINNEWAFVGLTACHGCRAIIDPMHVEDHDKVCPGREWNFMVIRNGNGEVVRVARDELT